MKTSGSGILALLRHEAIVPAPYLDSAGVWTYGIGHAATSGLDPNPAEMRRGMPVDLTAELVRVFEVFRADLPKYEDAVRKALPDAKQHEFDAAVSFHFNTGAIARAKWVTILRAGDAAGAARSLMANWSARNPELKKRREAERDLLLRGTYGEGPIPVFPATPEGKVIWKPVRMIRPAEALDMLFPIARPPAPAPPADLSVWQQFLTWLQSFTKGRAL